MSMYYFVGNNGQQNGPVPAETLKDNGVTLDTLVWCEGMAGWTKVADVEELAPLFAPPAPPTPPVPPVPPVPPATPVYHQPEPVTKTENTYTDPTVNQNIRPDTYLVWSILATLFCCRHKCEELFIESSTAEHFGRHLRDIIGCCKYETRNSPVPFLLHPCQELAYKALCRFMS